MSSDPGSASRYSSLRDSFSSAEAASGEFARHFYAHLFDIDPGLAGQFENVDMATQGAMVLQAVRVALDGLEDLAMIQPTLESLGHRHAHYGVRPEQYATAVEAFVRAFRQLLGDAFDHQLEAVWRETLSAVAGIMVEGAKRGRERCASAGLYRTGFDDAVRSDPYTARFMPGDLDVSAPRLDPSSPMKLPRSFTVEYAGEGLAAAGPLQTILDVSLQNNIPHVCVCGGIGKCSTCRVVVLEGADQCLPRNQVEARMARLKGFSSEIRLACQTRIMGPVVLKRLVHDEADVHDAAELGSDYAGRELPLAVMFTDIKGFTPFAESNLAYDVVHALNRYFDVVGRAVDARGGYIDKYIGDGVMVLFGLDRGRDSHPCVDAVEAAFDALSGMRAVNGYLETHLDRTFQVAIGIHYGHAVVGEVGYKLKRQFTAIGDVVNTAARLEDEAKRQGVGLLVTEEVLRELPPAMCRIRKTVQLTLRGKTGETTAYGIGPQDPD